MPTAAENYRALNEDPEFRSLPYEQQVATRFAWFQNNMGNLEDFEGLTPVEQQRTIQQIVTQPPSFANPERSEFSNTIMGVAQGLRAGDEESILAASRINEQLTLTGFGGLITRGSTHLDAWLQENVRANDPKAEAEAQLARELLTVEDEDDRRALDYMQANFAEVELPGSLRARQVLAAVTGLGVNIAAGRLVAGGALAAVNSLRGVAAGAGVARNVAAMTSARAVGASRIGKWMFASAIPEFAESIVDGVMMTTADILSGNVEENTPDWLGRAQSRVGAVVRNFGYNVATDMLFFTGLNILGSFAKQATRVARVKRGMRGAADSLQNVMKNVDDESYEALYRYVIGGEELPKEVFNSLPRKTQASMRRMRRQWSAVDTIATLDESQKLDLLLGHKNMEVRRVGGGYKITRDGEDLTKIHRTLDEALAEAYKIDVDPGTSGVTRMDVASLENNFEIQRVRKIDLADELDPDDLRRVEGARDAATPTSRVFDDALDDVAAKLEIPVTRAADGSVTIRGFSYAGSKDAFEALSTHYAIKLLSAGDEASISEISRMYSKQYGITLKPVERKDLGSVRWEARRGEKLIAAGNKSDELVRELADRGLVPKLSQKYAPDLILDESANTLTVVDGAARGPASYLNELSAKFYPEADNADLVRRFGPEAMVERDPITTTFRVTDSEWNVVSQDFATFEEAQKFVNGKVNSIEKLRDRAFLKGFTDVDRVGDHILLRNMDGTIHQVDNLDEATEFVKKAQRSPMWEKEITNMDPKIIDSAIEQLPPELKKRFRSAPLAKRRKVMKDLLNDLGKQSSWIKDEGQHGIRLGIQKFIGNMNETWTGAKYNVVNRIAGEQGLEFIKDSFEHIEKQMKNNRGLMQRVNLLIEASQNVPGVGQERRRLLGPLLEMDPSKWDNVAGDLPGGLTTADRNYLNRTRRTLKGLGDMFGVDAWKMWNNYLPHIRMAKLNNPEMFKTGTAVDIMKQIFPDQMPKEIQFFGEHLRGVDLVQWLDEQDPKDLITRYAAAGIKNMTLGEGFREVMRVLRTNWKKMPDSAINLMTHYLQETMGMYGDHAAKMAKQTANDIAETFGSLIGGSKADTEALRTLTNTFHSFTIAATMAFRPWLPIRNMQQIWTTLAGHVGNSTVMRALRRMDNADEVGKRAQHLRETGRLMSNNPMFELSGLALLSENKGFMAKLRKWTKYGMLPYQNSDEYTRIVVDFVVDDMFTGPAAAFEAGEISYQQFLKRSSLDIFDVEDQKQVVKRLQRSFVEARDYYGDMLTRETMFAYTPGSNPSAWSGVIGKMFGMFGHYPIYFAQNLRNGLRRGSLAHKAAFTGRVVFNSAALWFTFEQVLGINADNFLPHKTMFFDGGPYFKLLGRGLSAMRGGPGAPSREQVLREAGRILIPGSLAFRGFVQGLESLANDDPYEAFLRFMSVPVAD